MSVDVTSELSARFAAPLAGNAARRVVFWHDAAGSFDADFERLVAFGFEGGELPRPVRLVREEAGSVFALKKLVYRDDLTSDFLIYTRRPKDYSAAGLEGDWLADLAFISEHFQADFASMLADELGVSEAAADAVQRFVKFFGAAERRKRFSRLVPHPHAKEDVALGVIAATLGAPGTATSQLVGTYLLALAHGEEPNDALAKYDAAHAFSAFLQARLGYLGDVTSADDLATHIFLSALSCTLPEGSLKGLEQRFSTEKGPACLNVLDEWRRDGTFSADLYELARRTETSCNLAQRFGTMDAAALGAADALPCINERILTDLMHGLAAGADRAAEARDAVRARREQAWHTRVAPYFAALSAASDASAFYREHAQGFHLATSGDVWRAYTGDWYRMDTSYRHFCRAFDECLRSSADVPPQLDEALDALATWMENLYANWYLVGANACWCAASEQVWAAQGCAEGVPRQDRFYDERVLTGAGGAKRTVVLVSDALRFEVAAELAARLETDLRGTAKLDAVHGVFPSITEFGMAALLPHHALGYNANEEVVSCDGMPAMNTAQREAVLRSRTPRSRALQAKDLLGARRADRKALIGDAEVVYVYHNKIDSTGEEYATEHDVVSACDTAIGDIVALVRAAVNDLGVSRVLITADHGFIYTRNALSESDKVGKDAIGGAVVKLGRRYAVVDGPAPAQTPFVRMSMDAVTGGTYVGLSPRECVRIKKPGPGECYVHGGSSLQELCVPVIEYRNRRAGAGGAGQQKATLKLLDTHRRVNSMLFGVRLFQPEAASGKVLPSVFELVMCDSMGNEVSNVATVHADLATDDATARQLTARMSLKAGNSYSPAETYHLLCRDAATREPVWKEEYQIDIAFAPTDDFGF